MSTAAAEAQAAASARQKAAMDKRIASINAILRKCGLDGTSVSATTNIFTRPEAAHIISDRDLQTLANQGSLLFLHKSISCNYEALSFVLWGILRFTEEKIDEVQMEKLFAPSGMGVGAFTTSLLAAPTASSTSGSSNGTVAVNTTGATVASAVDSRASARQQRLTITNMTKLYYALYPVLQRSQGAFILLRLQEELIRQKRMPTHNVKIVLQDVDMCVRLINKINGLLHGLSAEAPHPFSVRGASYSVSGHRLFRTAEVVFSSAASLAATVVARPKTDVHSVIRLFNSEAMWRAGGFGLLGTTSFCIAMEHLARVLLVQRRRDFDNVEDVVSTLLLTRIARRPPLDVELQALLFFRPDSAQFKQLRQLGFKTTAATSAGGNHALSAGYATVWLLMNVHTVMRSLQLSLTVFSDMSPEDVSATLSLRRAATAAFRARQETAVPVATAAAGGSDSGHDTTANPKVLSFYELLVLAALEGMPEADFTDDAALVTRAKQTLLTASPEVLEQPSVLRLVLGFAFTVSTSGGRVQHAPLSDASVLALLDAVQQHYFQLPKLASSPPLEVNRHFASGNAGLQELIALLLSSALQGAVLPDSEDDGDAAHAVAAATSQTGSNSPAPAVTATGEAADGAVQSPATANPGPPSPSTAAGSAVPPASPGPAAAAEPVEKRPLCVAVLRRVLEALKVFHQAVKYYDEKFGSRRDPVPAPARSVILTAVTQLFRFFGSQEFLTGVSLEAALEAMARIYALRTYFPISPMATREEQRLATRLIFRMQQKLAQIVALMRVDRVNTIFISTLLPLSTSVALHGGPRSAAPRLQLAMLEAYLRAYATSAAAFAVRPELLLQHWVNIALSVLTNSQFPMTLQTAAHDFLIAPFLAQRPLGLLFVPTYVSVFIRSQSKRYGEPPLRLVQHFARSCRAACQGIEKSDEAALLSFIDANPVLIASVFAQQQRQDSNLGYGFAPFVSPPPAAPAAAGASGAGGGLSSASATSSAGSSAAAAYITEDTRNALLKLSPTSACLLVVAGLFDKLSLLWSQGPGSGKDAQNRFVAYFTALVNLLQCNSTAVLHRVCASVETIEIDHLRGSGQIQLQFLDYIGKTVDRVQGPSKKGVAEWFLKLNQRVREESIRFSPKL